LRLAKTLSYFCATPGHLGRGGNSYIDDMPQPTAARHLILDGLEKLRRKA
jgi:hypothetical protein